MFAYGLPKPDESWEDYAAKHGLTILVQPRTSSTE